MSVLVVCHNGRRLALPPPIIGLYDRPFASCSRPPQDQTPASGESRIDRPAVSDEIARGATRRGSFMP
jgi:hypothetical protein